MNTTPILILLLCLAILLEIIKRRSGVETFVKRKTMNRLRNFAENHNIEISGNRFLNYVEIDDVINQLLDEVEKEE